LVGVALAEVRLEVPALFQLRVNAEVHPHPEAHNRLAEACGMTLLLDKLGVWWEDDGTPTDVPERLDYRTLADIGADAYADVMGRCQEGTIDRNDRYYWGGCGPEDWGRVMVSSASDEDAGMWLVGCIGTEPVGYVAVTAVKGWGSTITHVGVLPHRRGNGYIHDLLAAGTAAAQRAGIRSMLSDADVLNEPMLAAFRRAGHRDDARLEPLDATQPASSDLASSSSSTTTERSSAEVPARGTGELRAIIGLAASGGLQ
jgi:ribosomal protein S18 acetylase RimI-like enzyme